MKTEAELESYRKYWNFSVRLKNLWNWRTRWAVHHLSRELKRDPGFRQAWHANIAMPIYDATRSKEAHDKASCGWKTHMEGAQCDAIADRILKHLFGA